MGCPVGQDHVTRSSRGQSESASCKAKGVEIDVDDGQQRVDCLALASLTVGHGIAQMGQFQTSRIAVMRTFAESCRALTDHPPSLSSGVNGRCASGPRERNVSLKGCMIIFTV